MLWIRTKAFEDLLFGMYKRLWRVYKSLLHRSGKMATGSACRVIGNSPRGVIRNVILSFGDHSDFWCLSSDFIPNKECLSDTEDVPASECFSAFETHRFGRHPRFSVFSLPPKILSPRKTQSLRNPFLPIIFPQLLFIRSESTHPQFILPEQSSSSASIQNQWPAARSTRSHVQTPELAISDHPNPFIIKSSLTWKIKQLNLSFSSKIAYQRSIQCFWLWTIFHFLADLRVSSLRELLRNHTYERLSAATDQQSFFSNQIFSSEISSKISLCFEHFSATSTVYPNQNKIQNFHMLLLSSMGSVRCSWFNILHIIIFDLHCIIDQK